MNFSLWPVHPRILPGEILSSWLVRTAHANGFQARAFCADQLGYDREIWRRDIDHLAPSNLIAQLSNKTGTHLREIAATTLRSYEGIAFERFVEHGKTKWVLPLGVQGRKRRLYGQQYCPVCLATDPVPYLRLRWRMAFQVVCTLHATLMADRCLTCGGALAPHRIDAVLGAAWHARNVIRYCGHCHADLARSAIPADAQALRLQRDLDEVVRLGYVEVGKAPVYSHLFLDGLQHLMTGLRRSVCGRRGERAIFESQSASERLIRLLEAMGLLRDWPLLLLERCQNLSQPFRRFVRQGEVMPWWLWSILRREVFLAQSVLQENEKRSILDASEKITGRRSGAQARLLSGRNVANDEPRHFASEEEVDVLIAHVDHRIAVASDAQKLRLLRDKIIFLVARRRRLGASALAAMTVREVARHDDCSGAFWCNAQRPGDVARLVGWYLRNVRPAIAPNSTSEALFISRSGQGMTRVAIGSNLRHAVRTASMRSRLASWTCWCNAIPDSDFR